MLFKVDNFEKIYNKDPTQFTKIKQSRECDMLKGLGHSQTTSNHFNRRNFTGFSVCSISIPETLFANNLNISSKQNKLHSHQLWSMPHLKTEGKTTNNNDEFSKNNKNYGQLTERRCNYEKRMQHLLQHPQSSSAKYMLNSGTPTYLNDKNHNLIKASQKSHNTISDDFLLLNEFRILNSNDCFSKHSQKELFLFQLPDQSLVNSKYISPNKSHETNWKEEKRIGNAFKYLSTSSKPYAFGQRMLCDNLADDPLRQTNLFPTINKSLALSYQKMY